MSRATIIAIVGKSGAGKTYASTYLQMKYGWQPIVSFTTRERREDEMDGREHFFVTKEEMPEHKRMVAFTQYGGHYYWTVKEQFMSAINKGDIVTYIVDEYGLHELRRNMRLKCNIITVKINREGPDLTDEKRKERDSGRFALSDSDFDYVVTNNGSESSFQCALSDFSVFVRKSVEECKVCSAWVARCSSSEVCLFTEKPQKLDDNSWWTDEDAKKYHIKDGVFLPDDAFPDLTEDDEEPVEVELRVIDDDTITIRRVK